VSFSLKKALIVDELDIFSEETGLSEDDAFMHWFYNLLNDQSDDQRIPEDELVDGEQEKQVDIFSLNIDESPNEVMIDLIQVKNATGFSSNVVSLMQSGLQLIFKLPRRQVKQNGNKLLVQKILEARQAIRDYGPSSVSVRCLFVTKGDETDISDEAQNNRDAILHEFNNQTFNSFEFAFIGVQELHRLVDLFRSVGRKISYNLPISYDSNRSSIIEFSLGGVKSLLCTVSGVELAKMAQSEPRDAIFDKNVRKSLGFSGKVNKNIYNSAVDPELAQKFWFMNNGITVVCDSFDAVKDADEPLVKISNLQIINGCQTTSTIRRAFEDQLLDPSVLVQMKLYASKDESFVSKVVIATNNQNSIGSRDLCANDEIQGLIQQRIRDDFNLFYERKRGEAKSEGVVSSKVIYMDLAGQALLAIFKMQPSLSRAGKQKIFDPTLYNEIYNKFQPWHLAFAHEIHRFVKSQAYQEKKELEKYSVEWSVLSYGLFHLSRIIWWVLKDTPNLDLNNKQALLLRIRDKEDDLMSEAFSSANDHLIAVAKANISENDQINNYFKSSAANGDINKYLKNIEEYDLE